MNLFLPSDETPSFSVVINTFNRANLLGDAISGVLQLDYPKFELIVVNGPSTDNSEEVLKRWHGQIKHLHCDAPNLSESRNVGIEAASGDIVAYLDDDAVPHPLWLRYLARHYANPAIGGVGGFTVDNTGMRWQVRKTVCDRFGNAHYPDDFFDERALNFPGTPYYPSLLGTNSSFRRRALFEIGGFDHTFAYLLDETDVCLRLVDAGWQVVYEPSAMIFHQFAESHIRSVNNKPKTLYPSVVSKSYFINRHGQVEGYGEAADALRSYREEVFRANAWLEEHGNISSSHRVNLDNDLESGMSAGIERANHATIENKMFGDMDVDNIAEPFLQAERADQMRIVLVSQGLPPENDAGIARWTKLLAQGLRDLGIAVHLVSRAQSEPLRRFRDGMWFHEIVRNTTDMSRIAAQYQVPESGMADWMSAVSRELDFIKTFGLDLVSFPIWDLEALPVLDDPELASVISLHTTYKLAKQFKPEWSSRVIYGRTFVDKVIAAETRALKQVPAILANSQAVIDEIENGYDIEIADKCRIVPHGTPDILKSQNITIADKVMRHEYDGIIRVLFAGRFEPRKGYDLALQVADKLQEERQIEFVFAGAEVNPDTARGIKAQLGIDPMQLSNAKFHGEVDRATLDSLFAESDVVLMPSRFESFGLVAIEAMSAGSPVLALASGGLKEVVTEGVSGFLYKNDQQFVKGAVEKLVELANNSVQLSRLQESSHVTFSDHFSIDVMAKSAAQFYRDIIIKREETA